VFSYDARTEAHSDCTRHYCCAQAKKRIPKSLDMSGKAPDDNRDYDDDVINDDVVDDVAEDSDEDYSALAKKPKGKGAAAKGKAAAKTAAKTKPTVTKARAKK
jgi:hypothetical protein